MIHYWPVLCFEADERDSRLRTLLFIPTTRTPGMPHLSCKRKTKHTITVRTLRSLKVVETPGLAHMLVIITAIAETPKCLRIDALFKLDHLSKAVAR